MRADRGSFVSGLVEGGCELGGFARKPEQRADAIVGYAERDESGIGGLRRPRVGAGRRAPIRRAISPSLILVGWEPGKIAELAVTTPVTPGT